MANEEAERESAAAVFGSIQKLSNGVRCVCASLRKKVGPIQSKDTTPPPCAPESDVLYEQYIRVRASLQVALQDAEHVQRELGVKPETD